MYFLQKNVRIVASGELCLVCLSITRTLSKCLAIKSKYLSIQGLPGWAAAAAAAKSLQSCPTLCDPIDGSP